MSANAVPVCCECGVTANEVIPLYSDGSAWYCDDHYPVCSADDASRLMDAMRMAEDVEG